MGGRRPDPPQKSRRRGPASAGGPAVRKIQSDLVITPRCGEDIVRHRSTNLSYSTSALEIPRAAFRAARGDRHLPGTGHGPSMRWTTWIITVIYQLLVRHYFKAVIAARKRAASRRAQKRAACCAQLAGGRSSTAGSRRKGWKSFGDDLPPEETKAEAAE
jgi:hypothetical protein